MQYDPPLNLQRPSKAELERYYRHCSKWQQSTRHFGYFRLLPFTMPIDPDAPGRKAVFKMITDKLAYSNNTPEACVYCERKRGNKEEPLPLCGGCRSVRFCVSASWMEQGPPHLMFAVELGASKGVLAPAQGILQGGAEAKTIARRVRGRSSRAARSVRTPPPHPRGLVRSPLVLIGSGKGLGVSSIHRTYELPLAIF